MKLTPCPHPGCTPGGCQCDDVSICLFNEVWSAAVSATLEDVARDLAELADEFISLCGGDKAAKHWIAFTLQDRAARYRAKAKEVGNG